MPKKRIAMNSCDMKDIIYPNKLKLKVSSPVYVTFQSRKMSMNPFILDKFPCLMLYGSIYWKMNNIKTQGVVTSLKTLYMSNKPATLRSIKLYLK